MIDLYGDVLIPFGGTIPGLALRCPAKVAYGGVHPSVDSTGKRFTGTRGHKAGMKLAGGPFALVSIR